MHRPAYRSFRVLAHINLRQARAAQFRGHLTAAAWHLLAAREYRSASNIYRLPR